MNGVEVVSDYNIAWGPGLFPSNSNQAIIVSNYLYMYAQLFGYNMMCVMHSSCQVLYVQI